MSKRVYKIADNQVRVTSGLGCRLWVNCFTCPYPDCQPARAGNWNKTRPVIVKEDNVRIWMGLL